MFTGIVEELGTVETVEHQGDALRLTIRAATVLSDAGLGDSISVNGCCLTVAERTDGRPFDDIEQVLPLAEADEIFSRYHALVGQPRPGFEAGEATGFRTWDEVTAQ